MKENIHLTEESKYIGSLLKELINVNKDIVTLLKLNSAEEKVLKENKVKQNKPKRK